MSWRTVNLGEIVDNFSVRAKDHPAITSELEFCGVSNEDGITKSKYAAEDKAEDYKIIEKDCFAYNPYRINVGSIGLLEDDTVGLISPAYVVFKPKPRSIIPQLLLKFLKSAEGLRQIKMYARGTVRQALRYEDLCKIEITIPDYDEQIEFFKRISETEAESIVLSTELTHQLDLVKQLRQAFLREAMQGKLVPQDPNDEPASVLLEKIKAEKERLIKEGKIKKQKPLPPITAEEIPFEIPENWVWCKIGDISSSIVPNRDKPKSFSGTIPWITQTNFSEKSIKLDYSVNDIGLNLEEIKKYNCRVMPKGSIVMSCVGRFDLVCFIDKDIVANQQLHCFTPIIKTMSMYLVYGIKLLNIEVAKTAIHTTIKYLNKTKIESIPIPLPPLSEQQRIVAQLNELMAHCDELEASIKASQQQNELLLQQVLREALEPKEMKA
jgi:restriction endonuclease S subunit